MHKKNTRLIVKNHENPGSEISLLRNCVYFYVTIPSLHYTTVPPGFQVNPVYLHEYSA